MCILLSTTTHPDYPLIILSNRDEFFVRPTKLGHFRPLKCGGKILSPLDLAREEHGTWIGVKGSHHDGKRLHKPRIAILLNYREDGLAQFTSEVSRGILPLAFLELPHEDDLKWQDDIRENNVELSRIGGFTLVYGSVCVDPKTHEIDHLKLISNRGHRGTVHDKNSEYKKFEHTFGVSNSLFTDPWKKVEIGTAALEAVAAKGLTQDELVKECFSVLSEDTYDKTVKKNGTWEEKLMELRNSVFIPPLDTGFLPAENKTLGRWYGTRTQTVILVDKKGSLHYYERDLHNSDTDEVNEDTTVRYYELE